MKVTVYGYISFGFCAELETQIVISKELGYLCKEDTEDITENLKHITCMLRSLIKKLRENRTPLTANR